MKITQKKMTVSEGLTLGGFDLSKKGAVKGRVLVRYSSIKSQIYSFRFRKSDQCAIYRYGKLDVAEATYIDGKFSHVILSKSY